MCMNDCLLYYSGSGGVYLKTAVFVYVAACWQAVALVHCLMSSAARSNKINVAGYLWLWQQLRTASLLLYIGDPDLHKQDATRGSSQCSVHRHTAHRVLVFVQHRLDLPCVWLFPAQTGVSVKPWLVNVCRVAMLRWTPTHQPPSLLQAS